MNEALFEEADAPTERSSLLPGQGFFVPNEVSRERADAEAAAALDGAEVAVVADPDADGLTCAALIREAFGTAALVPTGPHDLTAGLERVASHAPAEVEVYVCDLCPDPAWIEAPLRQLVMHAGSVRWFDHHRWDEEAVDLVREAGVELAVGDSEAECAADVTLRELDASLPGRFDELVEVVRDHDLWIRDDPRSDDLADFAYWVDPEEFVDTVRTHGADLPEAATALLEERRVVKADRIDRAVRRADYHQLGSITVGVTYGRCSQNEVAEAMREAGADAAVIVKPAGSASIRGTEGFERCHEVARLVGGGGHPKAAGCKPDIYRDMLDYAHHWTTQGAVTKRVILQAFATVLEDGGAGT